VIQKDQAYFEGVGNITNHGTNSLQYQVKSLEDLKVILGHFDKYPLITQKRADYALFKQGFDIINRKEHLTTEGLHKIVAIKASMNNGLSDGLKLAFPNTIPAPRSVIVNQVIKDPNWLAGFTSGEGSFFIDI